MWLETQVLRHLNMLKSNSSITSLFLCFISCAVPEHKIVNENVFLDWLIDWFDPQCLMQVSRYNLPPPGPFLKSSSLPTLSQWLLLGHSMTLWINKWKCLCLKCAVPVCPMSCCVEIQFKTSHVVFLLLCCVSCVYWSVIGIPWLYAVRAMVVHINSSLRQFDWNV